MRGLLVLRKLAGLGAVAAVMLPVISVAQDNSGDEETVEEIVVTGSRIARRDFTAPSPISTIEREVLIASPQPTLEETLNKMPQITPDYGRASNNPGNGQAHINLRGLGSDRTLVMLNGRRLAPSGIGSSVDVNNLPQVLMERVEVITGGAATVYGSDAISGVVNFITRDDFDGWGIDASAYVTEEGDSEIYDVNMTWGHNYSNGNITVFGGYLERGESFQADREFTEIPWRTDDFGNIFPGGSSAIPAGHVSFPRTDLGDGNPVPIMFTDDGAPVEFVFPDDLYNYAPVNYMQVPLNRYSGGIFGTHSFGGELETYYELTHTRTEGRQNLAPVPVFAFLETTLNNPVMTPEAQAAFAQYIPTGPDTVGFFLRRRMEELGFRIADTTNDYSRFVAGLRGDINENWDFDVWATYTNGEEEELLLNDASFSRLQQGLLVDSVSGQCIDPANGCVPVDLFGAGALTEEMLGFIRSEPYSNLTSRTQKLLSGYVRGSVFDLPAGAIDVAVGLEWRNDQGDFAADDSLFLGDNLGWNGTSSVIGEETVKEVYAEALVPLLEDVTGAHRLSLEVGGRYSSYDNAGSSNSWKFGAEWAPVEALSIKAMLQRTVRAPNLDEAFRQESTEDWFVVDGDLVDDPCTAAADPISRGNVERCVAQGIPESEVGTWEATPFYPVTEIYGGNPNLASEDANTFTIGAVYTGFNDWEASLYYFDIEIDDVIASAESLAVCFSVDNDTNALCDNITRDIDPANDNYNISTVDYKLINAGVASARGYDAQLQYTAELPGWMAISSYADLTISVVWTHLLENNVALHPALDPIECKGYFGGLCSFLRRHEATFPENRTMTMLQYGSGNFSANLSWRWIDGSRNGIYLFNEAVGEPPPTLAIEDVGSKSYFDLSLGYRINDNISLRLNVANLSDTDPVFMADATNGNNTDAGMYDVFGRSYRLSIAMEF
jgi:outer membrane receptor protein involved in Fe transport